MRSTKAEEPFSVRKWVDSVSGRPLAERERAVLALFKRGYMPHFLQKAVPIHSTVNVNGKTVRARIYVSSDYFSIGTDAEWMRMPLSPFTAQAIADSLHCMLPTSRIVDLIHQQAQVPLDPIPLYAHRDSLVIFYHHHLMIEGQRKGRKGMISGIKKDVVCTDRLLQTGKTDRVAIYGWHRENGVPIQSVYTGHVGSYVDYSHGIRLVYKKIKVGHQWIDADSVMRNPLLRPLLTDEPFISNTFTHY